jgi:Raf kinase inhibitor-like YbhB/YbcL family protein
MKLTSSAFSALERIPDQHTGLGKRLGKKFNDISPPLSWTDIPEGTRELALICDDPDAPTAEPWVHWVIYGLSPNLTGLPEGIAREKILTVPIQALQGKNSWSTGSAIGYQGPEPPKGHGVHRYFFVLYALDTELNIPPGATKNTLLKTMQGHILAKAELIGTYEVS